MNRAIVPAIALLCALLSGCYSTTIRSGRAIDPHPARLPNGHSISDFDERWHHGFVNGIAEVDGNYDVDRICPQGWAEIQTRENFLNVVVRVASGGIYTPQSVTIRCAPAPAATQQAAPAGSSAPPPVPPPPNDIARTPRTSSTPSRI